MKPAGRLRARRAARRGGVVALRSALRVAVVVAIGLGGGFGCGDADRSGEAGSTRASAGSPPTPDASSAREATFVGSEACTACHAEEASSWSGSQHHRAMLPATPENVAGAFDGRRLPDAGGEARVFRRGDDAYVSLAGPDGRVADYRVEYALGLEPLQQYLVALPGGRLQALPLAWDARAKAEGGQRWLHLYPEARVEPGDPLHWTRSAQSWNHVCADCHVTAYRKRFDAAKDAFDSQWRELGVGCESCHGPGSAHVAWAGREPRRGENGLRARLDERRGVRFTIDPTTGNAVRSTPRGSSRELDVCAACHARRSALDADYAAGEPFLDHDRPALLEPGLYHDDGQQRDEVYSWGSFLQSRMHANGVTCSDCHDPHSGDLRVEGDALCASCHATAKYATPAHHRHAAGSAGSACVACHMPTTTYMQVDPRHDHSLRVPRPDQSVALGVPNACEGCHSKRGAAWADAAVRRWLGRPARGFERHAEAMQASARGAVEAEPALRAVARDAGRPAIVRASALARLDAGASAPSVALLAEAMKDADPLVRLGALEGLAGAPPAERARAAGSALRDPRRAVRFEAVRILTAVYDELSPADRSGFELAAREYEAALRLDADRAEARTQLGVFLAERGEVDAARRELEAAIRIEPAFDVAYVDLADLERAAGRDDAALAVLEAGLAVLPESAVLHHVRGLTRVRLGESGAALADLSRAATLDPGSARFAYVEAVALQSTGELDRALALLEEAFRSHPADRTILEALVAFHEQAGHAAEALRHRSALARLAEADR